MCVVSQKSLICNTYCLFQRSSPTSRGFASESRTCTGLTGMNSSCNPLLSDVPCHQGEELRACWGDSEGGWGGGGGVGWGGVGVGGMCSSVAKLVSPFALTGYLGANLLKDFLIFALNPRFIFCFFYTSSSCSTHLCRADGLFVECVCLSLMGPPQEHC